MLSTMYDKIKKASSEPLGFAMHEANAIPKLAKYMS